MRAANAPAKQIESVKSGCHGFESGLSSKVSNNKAASFTGNDPGSFP
jgi:hypothetical protein